MRRVSPESFLKMNEEILDKVYLNIKKYTKCSQLNLTEIGPLLGKSPSYLAQCYAKRIDFSVVILNQLAYIFNISLSDLIERDPKEVGPLETKLMEDAIKKSFQD